MDSYSDLDVTPPTSSPHIDGVPADLDEPPGIEFWEDKNGSTYVNADACDHPPSGARRKSPWWSGGR